MSVIVPECVQRGLDHLRRADGLWTVQHANESHLRDGLAAMWWLAGANVQTEVPVPNCGRIDLLVELPDQRPMVWEIKRSLLSVAAARKAFQQVDTYRRYWLAHNSALVTPLVAAADWSEKAASTAEAAFGGVTGLSFGEALAMPERMGDLTSVRQRMSAVADLASLLRWSEIEVATYREQVAA